MVNPVARICEQLPGDRAPPLLAVHAANEHLLPHAAHPARPEQRIQSAPKDSWIGPLIAQCCAIDLLPFETDVGNAFDAGENPSRTGTQCMRRFV